MAVTAVALAACTSRGRGESPSGVSNSSLTRRLETDVKEVLRMSTQKVKPDPGSLDRQQTRRLWSSGKKVGAFAVAAAIGLAACSGPGDAAPVDNATTPADEAPTVNPAEAEAGAVGTVTFDGSTCSLEITADRIEPGFVPFEVVNATEKPVMFDSYELQEGYTLRAFEAVVGKIRRANENGKLGHGWPGESEVRYLSSDTIPANSSGSIVESVLPGRHAIVCMRPIQVRGEDFGPFGIVGPIVVR
jgi:hypothetical protein